MHWREARKLTSEALPQPPAADPQPRTQATSVMTHGSYRGRTFFDGSKYPGGLSRSGVGKITDNRAIRINTRNAVLDSVQAAAILNRTVDSQVNKGLRFESAPVAELLGISEEEAEAKGRVLTEGFVLWANSLQSTLSETRTFNQDQRLLALYQHRDNDAFLFMKYSKRRDLISSLQVKVVDPEQLIGGSYTYTEGFQNSTADGIERDSNGKEIAYWLRVRDKFGAVDQRRISAVLPRSKRRQMLHGFRSSYADEGRGFSNWAHALQNTENLTDFELAQIKKAIMESNIAMYVKPSVDAPASNPFESFTSQVSSPSTGLDEGVGAAASGMTTVQYETLPEVTLDTPGSAMVFSLEGGEDLNPFKGTAPSDKYSEFMDSSAAYLSASMGMPFEALLMRFGQNYSASRAAIILLWNNLIMWRKDQVSQIFHPVFEAWAAEEVAAGRISLPGFSDVRLRAAWLSGAWHGEAMPNIDPLKQAMAAKLNLEMGATHLDAVAQELNGSDGRTNRAKLTRQLEELPDVPWGDGAKAAAAAEIAEKSAAQDEDDGNEDQEEVVNG